MTIRSTKKGRPSEAASVRTQDPFLAREQDKYEHPLPSREFILQVLAEEGTPVSEDHLAEKLGIAEPEREFFSRRLRAMEREGQLMRNRKHALCLVEKLDLVAGRVEAHADGFGFLIPDDGSPDLFLLPKEMEQVFHGDRVVARVLSTNRRGRREGSIVEVLEHTNSRLVGRLIEEHGIRFVEPEDPRMRHAVLIPKGGEMKAKPGQVVTIQILEQPGRHTKPVGRVVEVLGNYADPGMEIEIALRKYDLPNEFSAAARAEAAKLPKKVIKRHWAGRDDIRHLPLVTIDGETARDFDDAVYCARDGKDFLLYVAIADVSHYVTPGSPLDDEGRERGNSVYFPRRVIPMLPEKLSNELCSLNPEVERLCMVCEVSVSPQGKIGKYRFYPAVMYSHARLTYTQVAAALQDGNTDGHPAIPGLLPQLQTLYELYHALVRARHKRGAIDFETTETRMVFNDQGKIETILPVVRNDAHRLIEECMLAANVCASDFLQKNEHPALYRVHEGPTPEKLKTLRSFMGEFGLNLGGGDKPKAKDYAKLLEQIKGRPDAQLLQTVMLRSLQQAVYSPDNQGHFGLAYEAYTHFTSPIRRYPDLLIHRAIKAVLTGKRYQTADWEELGMHCSATERRADEATRDVEAWLKAYYMQDRVGESFPGTVSGVTGFGLFVALDDVYVEGLVHISELGQDYFHFDAAKHQLLGERTGQRYRLGDRLRIKLVRVDLETRKIDFQLDAGEAGGRRKGRR